MHILLRIVDVLSRIDHNFLETRRKPLERARRQLSNGFFLVEKDLISRKLGHILDSDKIAVVKQQKRGVGVGTARPGTSLKNCLH